MVPEPTSTPGFILAVFAALSLYLSLIVSAFVSPQRRRPNAERGSGNAEQEEQSRARKQAEQSRARLSSTQKVGDEEADPLVRESFLAPKYPGILSRKQKIDRIYKINKIANDKPKHPLIQLILSILSILSAPLRLCVRFLPQRSQRAQRRRRLYSGVAVFLTTCFVIGPEQVHALHIEALSAHLAAGSALGLTEDVTVDYTYDDNGNMIQRDSSVAGTTNFTYDSENRLIKVADPNGSPASITTYAYDTDGIRTAKIAGAGATTYLTDKNRDYAQVLEERNGDTRQLDVRYTYGHDLISQHRPDGTGGFDAHYYHYDGQISTRQLSDDQGSSSDRYTFDAFGELLTSVGDTINNYLYTGEQFDPNTGFYYLRARYYDHVVARFASRDAFPGVVSDPLTLHSYLYVGANPITRVDPSGYLYMIELLGSSYVRTMLKVALKKALKGVVIGALIGGTLGGYFHVLATESYEGVWQSIATGAAFGAFYGAVIGVAAAGGATLLAVTLWAILGINVAYSLPILVNSSIPIRVKVALLIVLFVQVRFAARATEAAAAEQANINAQATLQNWIQSFKPGSPKSNAGAAIAAYDAKTGDLTVRTSGPVPPRVAPSMAALADEVGGLGTQSGSANRVGCCAEFRAANALVLRGSLIENIRFSTPLRPRSGDPVARCCNCETMFGSE